jgi:bla regulator protein blaR1
MTLIAVAPASTSVLALLANSAARALALSGIAGLGLAAFRVKTTAVRLFTWTAVLYAALAMPLLEWMLPPVPVPAPAFLQDSTVQAIVAATDRPATEVLLAGERAAQPAASTESIAHASYSSRLGQKALPRIAAPRVVATAADSPSIPPSSPWKLIRWNRVAVGIYSVVALLLLVRFLVGLVFSHRLLRASHEIDESRIGLRLASRAYALGLASIPRAAESELIAVPLTMGVLRSTILLPAGWRDWDDTQLDAVVAHEVSHVARRDAFTQRLSLLHRAIFWFSPLAWWLDRRLADLAEQASDEAALTCGADRKDYATTLLGFFEALHAAPGRVWWQGVAMAKAGQAEKRVERILSWKGSVAMRLKKSIAVGVVALVIPVAYLAASVHAATKVAEAQHVPFLKYQTTPPAQRPAVAPAPKAEPSDTPMPAPAPTSEATPPPEPTPQSEPAPAPAAIAGTISGAPTPPPAPRAPAPGVATTARAQVAPVSPVAPVAPVAPVGPVAPVVARGQANYSRSSSGHGYSYAYGYDDEQRFVIVTGKSDSLTMSGSAEDARHVEKLRKSIPGDFIWFQRDEKSYIIRDQATIDRARKLWAPQEELGKKQEELGKQQEALGKQQEELGEQMEKIHVNVPDMTAELDKLKAELKKLSSGATVEQVGEIQSEIGELQSKIGEIQSHAGDQQGRLGEQMGALGEKQGKLGELQGELGRQQGELAEEASRQMKTLLDEAITKGIAQPEL